MIKKIASIYPIEMKAQRTLYSGDFVLPAYDRDKGTPVVIQIKDHVQYEQMPFFYAAQGAKRNPMARHLITAIEIANDIVKEWTLHVMGQNPQSHPGIWVVRDTVPLFDDDGKPIMSAMGPQEHRPATPQECEAMFEEDRAEAEAAQREWGEFCIQMGDIMSQKPEAIPWIPHYAKTLCRYYGRDKKWTRKQTEADVKNCPSCRSLIDVLAVVCPQCGRDVVPTEGKPQEIGRPPMRPPRGRENPLPVGAG
jgi:hypothetical protein